MQSAVFRLHVVCLSVCPSFRLSETLVDCNHTGWNLIARTISPTTSLFIANAKAIQLLPGEHGEILGRLEMRWGKVACWSIKAATSLKRVKIDQKLLCGVYRNSPTSFRTVPSPTPYGLLFPKIGVRNPNPKLQSLFSGTGKATDCNVGRYIYGVHPNKSPIKIWEKREPGRIQRLPTFLNAPYYPRNWYRYELIILYGHSQDRSEQKPIKNLGKSSLAVGALRDSRNFSRHPYYRAHRAVIFEVAQLSWIFIVVSVEEPCQAASQLPATDN